MQWNFLSAAGVNAPEAWANLIADHRPGARGVTVAILDTGVAYRNWHQYRKSPGCTGARFVDPYGFVANNRFPLDREGARHVHRRHDRRSNQPRRRSDRARLRGDDHACPGPRCQR